MWQHYTNAVLGLGVLGVAFLGLDSTTLTWTLAILGVAIAVLGLWGAGALTSSSSSESMVRHA